MKTPRTIKLSTDDYYTLKNNVLYMWAIVKCTQIGTGDPDDPYRYEDEYGLVKSKLQIGEQVMLVSTTNVSPNAIREGRDNPEFYLIPDCDDGIGGNSNHNIKRYHGWRGTTQDISCDAWGLRKITAIIQRKRYIAVKISDDLLPDED
jgi:hypothetical protein